MFQSGFLHILVISSYQILVVCSERDVYIDAGGRNGDTLRYFARDPLPSDKHSSAGAFKKVLNPKGKDVSNFHIHVFEALPSWCVGIDRVYRRGLSTGWKMKSFHLHCPTAVWDVNGTVNFFEDGRLKSRKAGSSIFRQKNSSRNPVQVSALDFSGWMKESFQERDYILLKMDIEGAEYKVLTKMIKDNTLCLIDKLVIEWHCQEKKEHCGGMDLVSRKAILSSLDKARSCGLHVVEWH
mmetsp:Transcript_5063/g.16475  ORF Transcript_5063/g.16475 Transcript_5063/m.16475 type:complete len:239 (-) Transcript_5063:3200-3916(-)